MGGKAQYPPLRTPIVGEDGIITPPWERYFLQIVTPYFESIGDVQAQQDFSWLMGDPHGLIKRIEDVENALQFIDGPKDATALKRIDELEKLIHGPRIIEHSPGAHIADASVAHAITDPGDAPADADALRDDLVANAIPEIEAAFDALGAKINELLARMEVHGLNHSA